MLQWHIVFKGESKATVYEGDSDVLARYDSAILAQAVDGRPVVGMWVIDPGTDNADILRAWGRCPQTVFSRYQSRQAQLKGTASS